jgi:hypothetical protein
MSDRLFAAVFTAAVRHDARTGGADVDTDSNVHAAHEMRAGPSDSEGRLRVQTTGCCAGPMISVVSEFGNGG